ncbi:hypothetical protein JYT11_00340 [Planctomycetaceae bacterium AH-315-I19]|nr:hypothetical protein [Planctomycetaceae bacterium AH-315-I19]
MGTERGIDVPTGFVSMTDFDAGLLWAAFFVPVFFFVRFGFFFVGRGVGKRSLSLVRAGVAGEGNDRG